MILTPQGTLALPAYVSRTVPCDVPATERPTWTTLTERYSLDRSDTWNLPVGLTKKLIAKACRKTQQKIWGNNIQSATYHVEHAHSNPEMYELYPSHYNPPFLFEQPSIHSLDVD